MLLRRLAVTALAGVLLGTLAVEAWGASAQLVRYTGTVKIQRARAETWSRVTRATPLYAGDHVQTFQRASATIALSGARVRLGPRAHVIIPGASPQRTSGSPLRTVAGRVWVWLIGRRTFEVGNNVAVASARGTQFVLDTAEDGTLTVTVLEGAVTFGNAYGTVVVGPREQSTAAPGQAPTRPMQVDVSGELFWEAALEGIWLPWEMEPGPVDLAAQEEQYTAALAAAPEDLTARLALTWVLVQAGRQAEALRLLAAAPVEQRQDPVTAVAAAVATLGLPDGEYSEVEAALTRAGEQDPQSALVPLARGFAAMRSGDAAGARTALTRALALDAKCYQAYAYLATVDLAEKRAEEARESAEKAVALAPESALARESLATVAFFLGEAVTARRELDLALETNPNSPTGHLLSSDLYAQAGDLDRALDEAQLAVTLDPGCAPAWSALGFLCLAVNDLASADRAFHQALALSPRLVAARTGMGVTYARQGKLAQALAMQEGAVALDSSSLAARNNLGAVYLGQGRLREALAQFQSLVADHPDWAVPRENLALTYLELQRYAEALQEGETAVRLGADSPRAHTTLARVYLRQNRVNKAWAELRRALDVDDGFALAHLEIAEVYVRLGKSRDALRHQLRALALQPGAIAESRSYARTEATLAGGSLLADLKTDGRYDDGLSTYYARAVHERDDGDRAHSDWNRTTALGMVGRQNAPDTVDAGYLSLQRDWRDRPGRLLSDGSPEDGDYTGRFTAYDAKYLGRRPAGREAGWTWKLGYTRAEERESNPDALSPADPKAFWRLTEQAEGPTAEVRYDRALGSRDALVAGAGYFGEDWSRSGRVGQRQPPRTAPRVIWSRFSDEADRDALTLYLWRQWQPGERLQAMVGGRMATRRGMAPVLRPEAYLRQTVGRHGTVLLLTRAVLADDVTELSPVQNWGLRDGLSPLDLTTGGYSQSYELQYEWLPASGALVRLAAFRRDLKNYVVDLQDPQWSAGAAGVVLAAGTLTGGELEAEHWLSRHLSAGLWVRLVDSENEEVGDRDIPYQPRLTGYARADYLAESGLRVSAVWLYVGKRYADLDNATRLSGYNMLSLRANWQQNLHTDWFVTVENVLDRDYAYWQGYPAPGRKARAGVSYRW